MITSFMAFLGVSAVVIMTPGPDTAGTVRNTLLGGRLAGIGNGAIPHRLHGEESRQDAITTVIAAAGRLRVEVPEASLNPGKPISAKSHDFELAV